MANTPTMQLNIANLSSETLQAIYDNWEDDKQLKAIVSKQDPGYPMHIMKRGKWLTVELFIGNKDSPKR